MARLSRVGLGDPFTLCRTADELSTGQRARLRSLMALTDHHGPVVLDDWLNDVDRVAARAVAWSVCREARRLGRPLIIATPHGDLIRDIMPDLHLHVPTGGTAHIVASPPHRTQCTLHDEIESGVGTYRDWQALESLHYAAGSPATTRGVHVLRHPHMVGPVGVLVMSYPHLRNAARTAALGNQWDTTRDPKAAQRLNRDVACLSRLVVVPEMRAIGLAQRLIAEAIGRDTPRYIECTAEAARYSTFLQAAGFVEHPTAISQQEAEWQDFASANRCPPSAQISPTELQAWVEGLSVRKGREARRLIWRTYHHLALYRRTKRAPAKIVPGADDPRWPEAYDLAARRLRDRPTYWVYGPIDRMTGLPDEAVPESCRNRSQSDTSVTPV